jgi:GNAT superfamily N-acetyltransferase
MAYNQEKEVALSMSSEDQNPAPIIVRHARDSTEERLAARALMQETFDYHAVVAQGEPTLIFAPNAERNYMEECLSTLIYGDEGYEPARSFLAWQGETAVGFALVRILKDYYYSVPYFGYIEQVIVTEKARSHGVGPLLLEACYGWLKSRNITTATLKVYGPNSEAVRFYEREGFSLLRHELVKHL